jgi:hypothetical protein
MRLRSIVFAVGVLVASPATAAAEDDPHIPEDQVVANSEASSEETPAPKDDPNVPDDQEVASYEISSEQVPAPMARDGSPCRGVTILQTAYNRAHYYIFRAYLHGRWCWSGGRVRSAEFTKWGTTASWTNWNYEGVKYVINTGSIGGTYRYQRAGYKFRACFAWYCVSDYPWISLTLRGNGTFAYDRGWS